jgi:hypothetical protein
MTSEYKVKSVHVATSIKFQKLAEVENPTSESVRSAITRIDKVFKADRNSKSYFKLREVSNQDQLSL